ncbi:MAG TPA: 30S ribosomal protein S6 [Thermodesulfobacteriota bacterium]|nr:30S ribosomal protein S6 [Thermodesulfobacteriota bacterium]
MSRHYETVCIVRPDAGEDVIKGVITRATSTLEGEGGKVNRLDEWGRRKLAYPIKKKHEGYYFLLDHSSPSKACAEMERFLRLSEDVIRYQTVRVESEAVPAAAPEAAPATTPGPAPEATPQEASAGQSAPEKGGEDA